jgi:hypothetical protein
MVRCHGYHYDLLFVPGSFRLAGKVSHRFPTDPNEESSFPPLTIYINYGLGSTIVRTVEHTFFLDREHVSPLDPNRAQPVPRYWASKKIDELLLTDDEESKKKSTELGKQYR